MENPVVTLAPRIIGTEKTPSNLRGLDTFSKKVVTQLPEVEVGYSLVVEFSNRKQLKQGRKRILMTGHRLFGTGLVVTRSQNTKLFVWLRDEDRHIATEIRNHRRTMREVCNA
ncbi:MAG: hypothetical protein CVU42_13700 [Chloroflexi bacterium HGW-Chloroflexi-4]|nr:MAG: hypothetical protein CVU42_13700 [Chloroflexi bacterium HGW-Chloroflexi-4]